MSLSAICYLFTQLDSKNWSTWSFKAEKKLKSDDQWKYIKGNQVIPPPETVAGPTTGITVVSQITNTAFATWKVQDSLVMGCITEMVTDAQVNIIQKAKTASAMWKALESKYERLGAQEQTTALTALATTRYKGIQSGPLQDHLDISELHADTLDKCGAMMDPTLFKVQLLAGLPTTFGPTKQILNHLTSIINPADIHAELLYEETR